MLKLLLHFVVTECRPILLLYFAYKSYLQDTIRYEVLNIFMTWNNGKLREMSNMTRSTENLGTYLTCLRDDVSDSLFAFNQTYSPRCAVIPDDKHRVDLTMNASALGLATVFLVVLICMLLASGVRDIGEGRYMAFTLGMRKKTWYRAVASLEVLFIATVLCRNAVTLWHEYQRFGSKKVVEFLEDYGTDALVLLYSAVKFFSTVEPSFAWESEEFQSLEFQRGWGPVFSETNSDFCMALELALYKASYSATGDLSEMCGDDKAHLRKVMQICAPLMDDDFETMGSLVEGSEAPSSTRGVRRVNQQMVAPLKDPSSDAESEEPSEGLLC